ncbi:DNA recombinase [Salmonella enterica subsp. enterica]|uniref:DNA recombinase n=1 Tax=Salmonella enterica I TaxID=59201 RepID=A0A379UMQ7_SALET|nr:DNA recombinase [Salmonella enterica subsp. enterica]
MKRKYLTQEEIEKLLSATDRMPFPERNRCLILMAFIHGFRASELLGLRLSDIDLAGRQLYIPAPQKWLFNVSPPPSR